MTGRPLVLCAAAGIELKACCAGLTGDVAPDPGTWRPAALGKREVLLLTTGIGPINAAGALGRLLGAEGEVAGVVNLGVAGSFDLKAHPLASTALVDREIWPEFGLRHDKGIDPQGIGFPLGSRAGQPVFERIDLDPLSTAAGLGLALDPTWPQATSLTVSGVTGTLDLAEGMRAWHADLENMEGFALAWTCCRNGVPFLEARTVSNLVGSRQAPDWALKPALKALEQVIRTLFSL